MSDGMTEPREELRQARSHARLLDDLQTRFSDSDVDPSETLKVTVAAAQLAGALAIVEAIDALRESLERRS